MYSPARSVQTVFGAALAAILLNNAVEVRARESHSRENHERVQHAVSDLQARLEIFATITAQIVEVNDRLVSVEPVEGRPGEYLLSVEHAFLSGLSDDELRAVIAHELGHVWIFTHHPFLQTEQLANDVALRVVTRTSLEQVYRKVWQRRGLKTDLARVLGQ